MKNPQYTNLLQHAARKMNEARTLIEKAEAEYVRRYGAHPSDANDDLWIDSMTGSNGRCNEDMTAEDVERGAVGYAGLPAYLPNDAPEPSNQQPGTF